LIFAIGALCRTASATMITVDTPTGATLNSLPVSAEAILTYGTGSLTITLRNLQDDPTSVVQNISGFGFVFQDPISLLTFGTGTLTSSSGLERTVSGTGAYADGSSVSTGWHVDTSGTGLWVHMLGVGGTAPKHGIIGDPAGTDIYVQANSSITGTPHNPFLAGDVVYNLTIPGLTDDAQLVSSTFWFNTALGYTTPGVPVGTVPEPSCFVLVGLGLLVFAKGMRRSLRT